jgi:hypothetical protein
MLGERVERLVVGEREELGGDGLTLPSPFGRGWPKAG